jgi:hypothetical protein
MENIQKQTYRYYYEDGLAEMAVGLLFTLVGFNIWLIHVTSSGSAFSIASWILLPVLTIGGVFGVQYLLSRLKEQLIYPRTGYVAYRDEPKKSRWWVIAVALGALAGAYLLPYSWLEKMSVITGAILCAALITIGTRANLNRLIALGLFVLISGLGMAYFVDSELAGLALTFVLAGLALLAAGGIGFLTYRSKSYAIHEEGNHV